MKKSRRKTIKTLTGLQKRYVDILHSMLKPNKGEAYRLAGSTMTNAKNRSCEAQKVLKKPHVAAYYNSLRQKATEHAEKTSAEIIEALENIAFDETEKTRDRIRALHDLGLRYGIFPTREVITQDQGELKPFKVVLSPEKKK